MKDINFEVGKHIYLKLQPYCQGLVAIRKNLKLSPWFFGLFKVLQRLGMLPYHLDLLSSSWIHPIFHVSKLKKKLRAHIADTNTTFG